MARYSALRDAGVMLFSVNYNLSTALLHLFGSVIRSGGLRSYRWYSRVWVLTEQQCVVLTHHSDWFSVDIYHILQII